MITYNAVYEKAKELGATIQGGINWTWANGFTSPEKAREFIQWLESNGFEHQGYSPACPNSSNPNLHKDGVRFR